MKAEQAKKPINRPRRRSRASLRSVSVTPPVDDPRFGVPVYAIGEAARFLAVPTSTFASWAKGYDRRSEGRKPVHGDPIVTALSAHKGDAQVPFGGLAEGMVLAAMRRAGVSLQHIRAAVSILERELGVAHALASKRLYTEGAELLFDHAASARDNDLEHLTVVVSGQRVFGGVVRESLERITYADDGWAGKISLPMTSRPVVEVDPGRSFGQPIFLHGAVRVED